MTRFAVTLVVPLLLMSCISAAQLRLQQGGIAAELQRLNDEGWLQAFRDGRCRGVPIETVGKVSAKPRPEDGASDVISDLSADQEEAARRSRVACAPGARRLRAAHLAYREARGAERTRADDAIEALSPQERSSLPTCARDDLTFLGAELAVARDLNLFNPEPLPFATPAVDAPCRFRTLFGEVVVEPDQGTEARASFSNVVVHRCGGTGDEACTPPQNGRRTFYRHALSTDPRIVNVVTGYLPAQVFHLGRSRARWRIERVVEVPVDVGCIMMY